MQNSSTCLWLALVVFSPSVFFFFFFCEVTVRYLCIPKELQAFQSSSGDFFFFPVGLGISVPVCMKDGR